MGGAITAKAAHSGTRKPMSWLSKTLLHWRNPAPKGLALPDYKALSNHSGAIKALPLYSRYYISLLQRDGEQAIPTVAIGDAVKHGEIIAKPTSHLALYRHAPTSGTVSAIVDISESHPSGMTVKALEITADGLDTPSDDFAPIPESGWYQRERLLTRIFHAGIAGMGGAGFPTEKKLNLTQPVETLILNGAECEPYITCDDLLMRHDAKAILHGAQLLAHILCARQVLVGIEDNKPEAISAMQNAADALADTRISIHVLPTQYPMGSRHQIAHALLGQRFAVSTRSHQSGFICHNVATAKAAYDAVALGKPLTERLVTFSGSGITQAGVYQTKVGTAISDIANDIGLHTDCDEIIFGGTMMGFSSKQDNPLPQVIKRETTSVLAFDTPHKRAKTPAQNCIRCGHCADICPMDLLPQQLQFYGSSGQQEKAEENRLFDCIECGLCTYVCPSDIPLVQIFQHSKGDILDQRQKKAEAEHARIRFETRNTRLENDKAERAKKMAERRAILKQQSENATNKPTAPAAGSQQDLIAAALARTQAKKTSASTPIDKPADSHSLTTSTKKTALLNNSKQDLIAAALARTQAKKAAQQTPPPSKPPPDKTS